MSNSQQAPWFLKLNQPADEQPPDENQYGEIETGENPSDAMSSEQNDQDRSDVSTDQTTHTSGDHGHACLPEDTFGVALSGGGIRSASFCLGIVQAMARANWLKRVDFLSTVSGGGYTGAFLGRFFDVTRHPERVNQALSDTQSQPLHWLRTHSNYLSPTGVGDTVFNLTSFWRNFLALQFVLIVFVFAVFGVANGIAYNPWKEFFLSEFIVPLAPITAAFMNVSFAISPWWVAAESLFWLTMVPLAVAYWIVSQDRHEDFILPVLLASIVLTLAVLLATQWPGAIVVLIATIFWIIATWSAVKRKEGRGNPQSQFRMALARNYLTNFLAIWSAITFWVLVIAGIDHTGRYLTDLFLESGRNWRSFYSMLGVGTTLFGLAPLLRGLAEDVASSDEKKTGFWAKVARIPYLATLILLGLGGLLPLTIVSFLSHLVFELGNSWGIGLAATAVALLISFLLGRYSLISFVNRSSMLTVYSARLARVFLGAVNRLRHRHRDGKDIGHVIEGDDIPMNQYAPHHGGGPLHLINVAVNETIDISSQRGIRDRKAENMAVGPAGINIGRNFHSLWTRGADPNDEMSVRSDEMEPIGNLTEPHPFLNESRLPANVEEMNLREWVSISGAAFSPGMGRSTSLAKSLLFTLTNLRLGYWWDSGIWSGDRYHIHMKSGLLDRLRNALYRFFAPQTLLLAEALGRFGGPWRRHWYLTDGGHFEVTGAYELLRRRVPFVAVIDAGADQNHECGVLAWLMRLTRIDFGAEFTPVKPDNGEVNIPDEIRNHLGTIEQLRGMKQKSPRENSGFPDRHATLFRVEFPDVDESSDAWHGRTHCWLLYIKATVVGDEPIDVINYQCENPDFPNESTLDQFFDEPQWESYRKLGEFIGGKLFQ